MVSSLSGLPVPLSAERTLSISGGNYKRPEEAALNIIEYL